MEQKRIDYLDIAKGIGIILVVLHHTSGKESFPLSYICSFHMPLFFIISGLCFNEFRYPKFLEYLKRKSRVLLWPLIAFTILMLILSWLSNTKFYTIGKFMDGFLPSAYWFVWVLYLVELAYYLVCKLSKSQSFRITIVGLLLVLGIIRQYYNIALPFHLSSVCYAFFFYAIGCIFRTMITNVLNYKLAWGGVILPVISAIFLKHNVDLSSGFILLPLISIPIAIAASISILTICNSFPQKCTKLKGILIWLGNKTLVILLIHMFAISLSCAYLQPYFDSHIIYKVIEQIFVWGISIFCAWLINNHARWMLGKK